MSPPKLFLRDPHSTLWVGDAFEFMADMEPDLIDIVVTDFPYAKATADGARGLSAEGPRKIVDFGHFTEAETLHAIYACARVCRRWMVVFMDHEHVPTVKRYPPRGWQFVRHGAWFKRGGAPQFSGDRPAQGWESVVILHPIERMHWRRGGHPATWECAVARPEKPEGTGEKNATEKPLPLLREILDSFADPGDVVFDPFCGRGGVLVAAKELGLKAIGIDLREKQLAAVQRRLRQAVLPGVAEARSIQYALPEIT